MTTASIATTTHGRVLVRTVEEPAAVLVGFHGYMENADIQMERLLAVAGDARWTLVSVQGLHRFYRSRSDAVIASWMTRQDRDDMIADNIEYFDRVVDTVAPPGVPLAALGFSQGVGMAYRGGVRGRRPADLIVAVGGDVPPELLEDPSSRFPPTLIVRGEGDDWYTAAKLDADVAALLARHVRSERLVHSGGHEWTPIVSEAAAAFIRSRATPRA